MPKAGVSIARTINAKWNEPSDLATRPHRYRKAEESGHGAAVAGIGVDW